jgi:protein-S-isoprenylcysteine O-methyltransferase Ste14
MNLLVLPVITGTQYSFVTKSFIIGLFVLIAAIGIPLSYFAYRYYFGNEIRKQKNVFAI